MSKPGKVAFFPSCIVYCHDYLSQHIQRGLPPLTGSRRHSVIPQILNKNPPWSFADVLSPQFSFLADSDAIAGVHVPKLSRLLFGRIVESEFWMENSLLVISSNMSVPECVLGLVSIVYALFIYWIADFSYALFFFLFFPTPPSPYVLGCLLGFSGVFLFVCF